MLPTQTSHGVPRVLDARVHLALLTTQLSFLTLSIRYHHYFLRRDRLALTGSNSTSFADTSFASSTTLYQSLCTACCCRLSAARVACSFSRIIAKWTDDLLLHFVRVRTDHMQTFGVNLNLFSNLCGFLLANQPGHSRLSRTC